MQKKCGCCLRDPFGAPRENCNFCYGAGYIDVEIFDENSLAEKREVFLKIKAKEDEISRLRFLALSEQNKNNELNRVNALRKQKTIEQDKLIEEKKKAEFARKQYLIDREYFEPSPTINSEKYFFVKNLYQGRLYKCIKCLYELNLDPNLACGNCGLASGFEGPI